jgi:hypothetical protein
MAHAFSMDLGELEKALAQLIQEGKIQARIDSYSKVNFDFESSRQNCFYRAFCFALRF